MASSGTTATNEKGTITLSRLGEHTDMHSLWVAVHGKVYDLTDFASDHPGGIEVLKDSAGTDATDSFEYAGHTDDAITVMKRFQVGRLEGSEDEDDDRGLKSRMPSLTGDVGRGAITTNTTVKKARGGFTTVRAWIQTTMTPSLIPLLTVIALSTTIFLFLSPSQTDTTLDGVNSRRAHHLSLALPPTSPLSATGFNSNSNTKAFFGGMMLATLMSLAGCAFLYAQFCKTLRHERDVFSYPTLIPRRVKM